MIICSDGGGVVYNSIINLKIFAALKVSKKLR
jgi:hypothetical protein